LSLCWGLSFAGGARRSWAQGVDSGWGCCLRGQWAHLWGSVCPLWAASSWEGRGWLFVGGHAVVTWAEVVVCECGVVVCRGWVVRLVCGAVCVVF
jgi:hypothetical protein